MNNHSNARINKVTIHPGHSWLMSVALVQLSILVASSFILKSSLAWLTNYLDTLILSALNIRDYGNMKDDDLNGGRGTQRRSCPSKVF